MSQNQNEKVRTELVRKSIHMMVAFVPSFAKIHLGGTMLLLASALLLYTLAEALRVSGRSVFLVSVITDAANRNRNRGLFVMGPVTLVLGAMLSLLLYPSDAASIAIYALAFGDGFSSLIGRLYGKVQIPYSGGKTFAGSFACLLAVFFSSFSVTGQLSQAAAIALGASFLEMLPSKDLDNIIIPLGAGAIAVLGGVGL